MDIESIALNRLTRSTECHEEEVGLAAFIVGSLCHEGYVPLNLNSSDSKQDFLNSIQLVSAILTQTKTSEGEFSQLPFPW